MIGQSPDALSVLAEIYDTIVDCVELVNEGEFFDALKIYCNEMVRLADQYLDATIVDKVRLQVTQSLSSWDRDQS